MRSPCLRQAALNPKPLNPLGGSGADRGAGAADELDNRGRQKKSELRGLSLWCSGACLKPLFFACTRARCSRLQKSRAGGLPRRES